MPFETASAFAHATLPWKTGTSGLSRLMPLWSSATTCRRYTTAMPHCITSCAVEIPGGVPLRSDRRSARGTRAISHAKVLSQCASAVTEMVAKTELNDSDSLKLTIDFPPEMSESRAGTLVSRYENNLNFMEKLLRELGTTPAQCQSVGGAVQICDNVNPQGGGEYLTDDECMVGLRTASCPGAQGRPLLIMINAGVDASTLGDVKGFDTNKKGIVILLNCGLDRLSWFAKLSFAKYIESYEPVYYLKNIGGNGWLLKNGVGPWRVFVEGANGIELVSEEELKPSLVDVEAQVRITLAGIKPKPKA